MLRPLLYTSLRLSPLRPYQNAVVARMLRLNINYGNPTPQWFIQFPRTYNNSAAATEEQSTAEKQIATDNDPRIIFGKTEFQTIREKYNMPKYVRPSQWLRLMI
jgi:hypothetical protein